MNDNADPESSVNFDARLLLTLAGFVLRAIRRHKLVVVAAVVLCTAGAVAAYAITPRQYSVKSRLLTSRSYLLTTLATSARLPYNADDPLRGAVEIVKSRDNLKGIVNDANLIERWAANRSLTGRLKDRVRAVLVGEMNESDIRGALIKMIDQRLVVYNEGEVLIFDVSWFTPSEAVSIIESAQSRFLEERRSSELAEVRETVRILEEKVGQLGGLVDKKTAEVTALMAEKASKAGGATRTRTISVRKPTTVASSPEAKSLQKDQRKVEESLRAVRRKIQSLERDHREVMRTARAKLNDLKRSLGPKHPEVVSAVRSVRELEVPPPALQAARLEESRLVALFEGVERKARKLVSATEGKVQTIEVPVETRDSTYDPKNDPEIERAIAALQGKISLYEDVVERLEEATTQMKVSESAFDFRYNITVPPLPPRKPDRPKLVPILGGGIFVGLFLAVALAILADLRRRTVIEPWMVEVILGVEVLGEVKLDERYENAPELYGGDEPQTSSVARE